MPAIVSDHHVITPQTRDEALRFLAAHRDEGWMPLAGGTDLMVGLYRDRNPQGRRWLNLWGLRPELAAIGREGDLLRVGGLATMTELRRSSLLRAACPLIAQAASVVGARSRFRTGPPWPATSSTPPPPGIRCPSGSPWTPRDRTALGPRGASPSLTPGSWRVIAARARTGRAADRGAVPAAGVGDRPPPVPQNRDTSRSGHQQGGLRRHRVAR